MLKPQQPAFESSSQTPTTETEDTTFVDAFGRSQPREVSEEASSIVPVGASRHQLHSAQQSKARISLRSLLTIMCCLAVIVVAVCCITVSFELSRKALEDVGFDKAKTLLDLAMAKSRNYLDSPSLHSRAIQRLVSQETYNESYMLPMDDGPNFYKKWLRIMEFPMLASNFTYFHTWLQTGDGGLGRTRLLDNVTASYYFHGPENPPPNEFQIQRVIATQQEPETYLPYPFPTVNGLKFAYWNRSIGFSQKQPGYLFWDNIALTAHPQRQIITIVCALHNSTGHFLGHSSIGINLKELNIFLRSLESDGDVHAIVTDGSGFVIGSSVADELPTNFTQCSDRDAADCILPTGGQCSKTPPIAPTPGIMCRYHATEFVDSTISDIAKQVPALTDPSAPAGVYHQKTSNGDKFFVATAPLQLQVMNRMSWRVSLITPEQVIMGGILESRNYAILVSAVCLVVGAILIFIFVNLLLAPIHFVSKEISDAARLQKKDLDMKPSAFKEIATLQGAFATMVDELDRVRAFVPGALFADFESDSVDRLSMPSLEADGSTANSDSGTSRVSFMTNPLQSGTATRENSLAGTSAAQIRQWGQGAVSMKVLTQERNVFGLRRYSVLRFSCSNINTKNTDILDDLSSRVASIVVPLVMKAGGIIDTLTPETVVATFNAHCRVGNHEATAMNCGIKLQHKLEALLEEDENEEVKTWSIVVDAAEGAVGTCGTDDFAVRSVIGEATDLTAQLHGLMSKHLNTTLLITDRIARACGHGAAKRCDLIPIDIVMPNWEQKGRHQQTLLYRPLRRNAYPSACISGFKTAFAAFTRLEHLQKTCDDFRSLFATHNLPEAMFMAAQCEYLLSEDGKRYTTHNKAFARNRKSEWEIFEALDSETANAYQSASMEPATSSKLNENESTKVVRQTMNDLEDVGEEVDAGLMTLLMPSKLRSTTSHSTTSHSSAIGSLNNNNTDQAGHPFVVEDIAGSIWRRATLPIGAGAFASVFPAMAETGAAAALKFLPLQSRKFSPQKIVDEVRVFSNMQHDNIVAYNSCAVLENHIVVVSEFMPLGSLNDTVAQYGAISLTTVKRFAQDILAGLGYLHQNNVVHCDIKPQNILLSVEGVCKLTDFGESISTAGNFSPQGVQSEDVVEPKLSGTAWFMAPEVALGENCTPASDIWSLGVTLLYLVSARLPYTSKDLKLGEAGFIRKMGKTATMIPTTAHLALGDKSRSNSVVGGSGVFTHASPLSNNAKNADETVESFMDFCRQCCQRSPSARPGVTELQAHPWLL